MKVRKPKSALGTEPKSPNARIAELYGLSPEIFSNTNTRLAGVRLCPFRNTVCDVSSNRNRVASLDYNYKGVRNDAPSIRKTYGTVPLPLGVCSCWVRRQNESVERPWILCPKRLLALEPPRPVIPKEVRQLIEIPNGREVGVWRELKFRRRENDAQVGRFFEYTFDFLLMELGKSGEPVGPPYIVEVMTSSTRGGGLSEHMADVLLGRPQRHLGNVVDSIYTPNYRQVFERMLGQFVAKSEIAEHWGGRTVWVFQDVLLDYIEQTTAFDSSHLGGPVRPNVFGEVYRLVKPEKATVSGLHLEHYKSLRGVARFNRDSHDFTAFLGLGYAPDISILRETLAGGARRARGGAAGFFKFRWGDEIDPRTSEPHITP
ncbi:MAG: hypothetical protein WAM91_01200 [Candidatus Acidiferrales bacterium]